MSRKTLMINFIAFAALLLIANPTVAKTLTVAEWNIESFPGRTSRSTEEAKQNQMDAAQKVLKQINPDIFIAEEIRDWDSFGKLVSVVPKLHVHTVSSFRAKESLSSQQVAIASSLPANSTWSERWKRGEANPPRGLAFAALTLPDGQLLFVYAVHLKSNSKSRYGSVQANLAMREDAAAQLAAHVADMEKVYKRYKILGTIIGGDLNTNLDKPEWKHEQTIPILQDASFYNTWTSVPPHDRLTWKGAGKLAPTTLDWILTKGLGRPTASMWKASEDASDHEPVVLKIEIPSESPR
jgi:endonuclease/exonuclease/phosphatase family metal-dependent hydrolase